MPILERKNLPMSAVNGCETCILSYKSMPLLALYTSKPLSSFTISFTPSPHWEQTP